MAYGELGRDGGELLGAEDSRVDEQLELLVDCDDCIVDLGLLGHAASLGFRF
jgi:hypothetical protein